MAIYLIGWYVLDVAALQFETAPEIQIWYPPSALDVVLLLVFGLRFWPALLLNTLVHVWWVTGRPLPLSTIIIFDLTTTIGYTLVCALLINTLRINPRLRQLRDVVWLTIVAALIAPLIIAVLQFVNFAAIGLVLWSQWLILTLHYWAGDSTGIGMLAPFLLILLRRVPWVWTHRESTRWAAGEDELRYPSRHGLPLLMLQIVMLALGIWAGYGAPRGANLDYTYFVFLPLMWIAVEYGLPRATTAVLGVNLGVAFLVSVRTGITHTLSLQFSLMGVTHTGILLGAIVSQRNRIDTKLRQLYQRIRSLNRGLERQVQERTAQLQTQMNQLQELNELKDDFLSTVSHELRSPLTNMKMAIRMLQVASTPENRDRYLQILHDECERETRLINDLLDLQRIEIGADAIALQSLSLQDWLPPIVEAFQGRAQNRQQALYLNLASDISTVVSDPAKLERIITELLTNACKYTPPGGMITLTIRASGVDSVELMVCNSGTEIPPAEYTRIFEKFYRIPSSDRWRQGGTGLGLALVQRLVQQLKGQIWVESQAMQTTFTVELSRIDEAEQT